MILAIVGVALALPASGCGGVRMDFDPANRFIAQWQAASIPLGFQDHRNPIRV